MDNVTHTLMGIALARTSFRQRTSAPGRERAFLVLCAALASNFPDFDIFMRWGGVDPHLLYLIEHRGITHSIALALPEALLTVLLVGLGFRERGLFRKLFWSALTLSVLGVLLHLVADFGNDYGVHPFWPLWNRWFYGDTLFILEPTLWLCLIPLAIASVETRFLKLFFVALGLIILGAAFVQSSLWIAVGLTVWALGFALAQWRRPHAIVWGPSGALAVVAIFMVGGTLARQETAAAIAVSRPGTELRELVSTPAPGNPFCYRVIGVSFSGTVMDTDVGVLSFAPSLIPPTECFRRLQVEESDDLVPRLGSSPALHWFAHFRGDVTNARMLEREKCRFAALMKFARIPYWNLPLQYASDLRYDTAAGPGFSRVSFKEETGCPEPLPPWEPPTERYFPHGSPK